VRILFGGPASRGANSSLRKWAMMAFYQTVVPES